MQQPSAVVIFNTAGILEHSEINVAVGTDGRRRRAVKGQVRIVAGLRILQAHARDRRKRAAVQREQISRAAIAHRDVNCLEIGAERGRAIQHHSNHGLIGGRGGHRSPDGFGAGVDAAMPLLSTL